MACKSPVESGRWAKEFPKQITASNPLPGLWISSGKVSQFASSISEIQFQKFTKCRALLVYIKDKIYLPHLSNAGSLRLFQRSFRAYFSILSDASTLVSWNPCSKSIMESTLFFILKKLKICMFWEIIAFSVFPEIGRLWCNVN